MRITLLLIGAFFLVPDLSHGQNFYRAGIFGGYSYLNGDFETRGEQAHGFAASIHVNVTGSFAFIADYSGHYKHGDFLAGVEPETRTYISTFLFGPRYVTSGDNINVFAYALFGGRYVSQKGFSETGFAIGLGGGIDYKYSKRLSLRVFQIDYIPTRSETEWGHNFRAEFGLVFNFGEES